MFEDSCENFLLISFPFLSMANCIEHSPTPEILPTANWVKSADLRLFLYLNIVGLFGLYVGFAGSLYKGASFNFVDLFDVLGWTFGLNVCAVAVCWTFLGAGFTAEVRFFFWTSAWTIFLFSIGANVSGISCLNLSSGVCSWTCCVGWGFGWYIGVSSQILFMFGI